MELNWEDKNILIVDDTKLNFVLLKTQLRRTKAKITWLENGHDAIEFIKNSKDVDLILMDIRMPLIDGVEATRLIKKIAPEIPIIIQTASVMGDAYDDIAKSGCDDTIFKPIDGTILLKKIVKLFDKYSK